MTRVIIATEAGDIEADLFTDGAPKAAANFVKLAKQGFYDDVVFHRVIPGFVIQGGDGEFGKKPTLNPGRVGTGGPGYKFEDEPITGDYVPRHAGDGQRRARTPTAPSSSSATRTWSAGCPRTTRSSARSRRASRWSTRSPARRATRAICPTRRSR